MIDRDTVAAFVAQVEAGDFLGAIERFYASDASMQENQAEPRRGRDNLLENERQMLAAFPGMVARRLSPILIDGDLVAIRWHFTMTPAEGPV